MPAHELPKNSAAAVLLPDPARGPWAVTPTLARFDDGRIECVGLTIEWMPMAPSRETGHWADDPDTPTPWPPGEGPEPEPLTAVMLRQIPLGRIVNQARKELPAMIAITDSMNRVVAEDLGEPPQRVRVGTVDIVNRRRRRRDDEHFRLVAEIYRRARASGVKEERKAPTRAVADEFVVAKSTAAGWVHEARKRGFLPPTRRGRARGADE